MIINRTYRHRKTYIVWKHYSIDIDSRSYNSNFECMTSGSNNSLIRIHLGNIISNRKGIYLSLYKIRTGTCDFRKTSSFSCDNFIDSRIVSVAVWSLNKCIIFPSTSVITFWIRMGDEYVFFSFILPSNE